MERLWQESILVAAMKQKIQDFILPEKSIYHQAISHRSSSCTSCRCRRDRDRCGRFWCGAILTLGLARYGYVIWFAATVEVEAAESRADRSHREGCATAGVD